MVKNFLISLLLAITLGSYSQKPPFKFGEINKEILELKNYEKDTTAAAVVLCEYGYYNESMSRFTRWIRIKILKKDGLYWGNRIYNVGERSNIKGYTYNLENDKIVKDKLDNKSIYKVKVTGMYYNFRVAMPNVKVGSVVDVRITHFGIPSKWHFQYQVPVEHSELIIESGRKLDYHKNFFGYERLDIAELDRWVAKDVPAFIPEPYTNSSSNYITKFEFDIKYIMINGVSVPISSTWEALGNNLLDISLFGGYIRRNGFTRSIAKEIEASADSEKEKVSAAYKETRKIKWNGEHSLLADKEDSRQVFKEQVGNSAEINFTLLQLLRHLDIEAYPVVLSTRDNGLLSPTFPSIQKLNHVIIYVKGEKRDYFLDATEDYNPIGYLPEKCLNISGRIIDKDLMEWVNLSPEEKAIKQTYMQLEIDEDFSVKGKVNYRQDGYAACNFRKNFHKFNSEAEFINDLMKENEGLKILNHDFNNLNKLDKPVIQNYDIEIKNQMLDMGDELIIYPFFFEKIEKNPFKTAERNYPVDFAYLRENSIIIQLTIPDGYQISEIPQSSKMQMRESACQVLYQVDVNRNKITLSYKMNINKEVFLPEEYPGLREFYNQLIKLQSQPIIVKKI